MTDRPKFRLALAAAETDGGTHWEVRGGSRHPDDKVEHFLNCMCPAGQITWVEIWFDPDGTPHIKRINGENKWNFTG